MNAKSLAVLIVEDSESDAELIVRILRKSGYDLASERVDSADSMKTALGRRTWDIVIADYRLPQFNAETALRLIRDANLDIPFLIVSGSIGEEIAVAMMKAGAHDYLMKDNLARLAPAVERELAQAAIRRERRKAGEALRASEEQYRLLAENIQDVIWILDLETSRFRYVSPSVQRLRGFTAEEVMAQDLPASLTQSSGQYLDKVLPGRIQDFHKGIHQYYIDEIEQPRKDGTAVWTEVTSFYRANENNGHLEVFGVTRDISERKRTQEALRESEKRYRLLAENVQDVIWVLDLDAGRFLYVSPSVERLRGYTAEEVMTQDLSMSLTLDSARKFGEALPGRIDLFRQGGGNSFLDEIEQPCRDGTTVWTEATIFFRINEDNGHLHIYGVSRNITERRHAEEALRASEERYRLLAENTGDTVWLMDMDMHILYISPSVTRQRGFSLEELNALPLERQMTPESLKRAMQLLTETLAPENLHRPDPVLTRTIELEFYRKDGSTFWTEDAFTLILDSNGKPANILGSARDITDRKRAEETNRRQLKRLAALRTIDTAIRGSLDLRLTLAIVLRETIAQLGVDAARILLLNPLSQVLEYAAGSGFHTEVLQHTRLRLGEGFAGKAALDQRVIHVPDLTSRKTDFLQLQNFSAERFITYFAVPLITKGQVIGVLETFHRKEFMPEGGLNEWQDFLETIAEQTAIAAENARLFGNLQQTNQELALAYDDTIAGWARAMDLSDRAGEGHAIRIAELTVWLAKAMGVRDDEILHIRRGALLHHVGWLETAPAEQSGKRESPEEESEPLRRHPLIAHDILSSIPYLRKAVDIPYCHHECWDGSGYPRGLKGDQIPLAARIFAVANTWDRLTNNQPDKPAWPKQKALDQIRSQAGKQFDPHIVEIFIRQLQG